MIATDVARARYRTTFTIRALPRLLLGIEYNPRVDEVNPLVNIVAVTETARRPALILGTSSDRIGTPDGQSYYLTFSKDLSEVLGLPQAFAPYIGASHGTYEGTTNVIGGLTVGFTPRLSSTLIFDGVRFHPTVNWILPRGQSLGLILVGGDEPGVSWSINF